MECPLVDECARHYCSDVCEVLDRFRGNGVPSDALLAEKKGMAREVSLERARLVECSRCGMVIPKGTECRCTLIAKR